MLRFLFQIYITYRTLKACYRDGWEMKDRIANHYEDLVYKYRILRFKYLRKGYIAKEYRFWFLFSWFFGILLYALLMCRIFWVLLYLPELGGLLDDWDEPAVVDGNAEEMKMFWDNATSPAEWTGAFNFEAKLMELTVDKIEAWRVENEAYITQKDAEIIKTWLHQYITLKATEFSDTFTRDVINGPKSWKEWFIGFMWTFVVEFRLWLKQTFIHAPLRALKLFTGFLFSLFRALIWAILWPIRQVFRAILWVLRVIQPYWDSWTELAKSKLPTQTWDVSLNFGKRLGKRLSKRLGKLIGKWNKFFAWFKN